MKRSMLKATTFLVSMVPVASVMAHAEVTGNNALQSAAHYLVHTLQAHPWLPLASGVAVLVIGIIVRMNQRES